MYLTCQTRKRGSLMKKFQIFTLILFLTSLNLFASDVILSNSLGAYYCAQEPNPKTWIGKKVEVPISIYWEDNVYPGFDDTDAKLMVTNYLDGVNLQIMALNTPDENVKIYSYKDIPKSYIDLVEEGYTVAKEAQEKRVIFDKARNHKNFEDYPPDFNQIRDIYLQADKKRETLTKQIESAKAKLTLVITQTTKEQMSQMNYTVKTDEVHLSDLARKVLYSDEVKITDNRTSEVIAYSRDIMQLSNATFLPDVAMGNRYYYPHPLCGEGTQLFERGVFIRLGTRGPNHKTGLNEKLYYKFTTKDNK